MPEKINRCPRCNVPGEICGDVYRCKQCFGFFDGLTDDGSDGGDYHADPSRRMELADEREKRKRDRLGGRRR